MRGSADETTVIVYHPQEPLKFLEGGRGGDGPDRFNAVRERFDAGLIHVVSKKFEG